MKGCMISPITRTRASHQTDIKGDHSLLRFSVGEPRWGFRGDGNNKMSFIVPGMPIFLFISFLARSRSKTFQTSRNDFFIHQSVRPPSQPAIPYRHYRKRALSSISPLRGFIERIPSQPMVAINQSPSALCRPRVPSNPSGPWTFLPKKNRQFRSSVPENANFPEFFAPIRVRR
jgi:hypothetical protein